VTEALTARSVRALGERYSNWGRWGPDDERGTLHFITPERVLGACSLPRRGRVISCALPFDENGPQTGAGGRHNPIHVMLCDGGDAVSGAQEGPGGLCYADDSITMPLQCGTQWDALSHISYDGRMYNDRDVRLVSSRGAAVNAITAVADGITGRGVLLDLPRFLRIDALVNGTPVLPRDLDACAEAQGVAIESGDVLLVRTGAMKRHLASGSWQGYIGATPGLSILCARWLYEREIAAVATDTFCVEVVPSEVPDCAMPLHMISLRNTGVHFGEMFQLEELAEACAEDGEYAFLFCAPPLPITGAVGSPINPLAIK